MQLLNMGARLGHWCRAASASTLFQGLVAYYPLNEPQGGTRNDAVGTKHLTDNNTVGVVCRGPSGTVANFANGTQKLSYNGVVMPATSFTVAGWIYLNPWSGYDLGSQYFLWQGADAFVGLYTEVDFTFYTGIYEATYTGLPWASEWMSLHAPQWSYIAFGYDAALQKTFISYNGCPKSLSASTVASITRNAPFYFGDSSVQAGTQVANWGIWSTVLSDAEILAMFVNNGKRYADLSAGQKTNLISYWNLDEVSGVRSDSHGTNHLSDVNSVGSATSSIQGAKDETAADFTAASTEYLSVGTPVLPANSDFTVAHWQKIASGETATSMVAWKTNGAAQTDQHGVLFEPVSGANHRLYNRRGFGSNVEIGDNRGSWILVVYEYVHATTTTRVMALGSAANSGTWSANSVASVGGNNGLSIGGPDAGAYMTGQIDELAVWSRVLTASERAELYNSGSGVYYA